MHGQKRSTARYQISGAYKHLTIKRKLLEPCCPTALNSLITFPDNVGLAYLKIVQHFKNLQVAIGQ